MSYNSGAIFHTPEFRRWLKGLADRGAKARILVRIERLAAGNPGHVRYLGGGVSELKVDHGPGYRIYFTHRSNRVLLLLAGGDKSTQSHDIARALRLALEYEDC